MALLKSKRNWPVVDGVPVEPYELPVTPDLDRAMLRDLEKQRRARAEADRTAWRRAMMQVVRAARARRGVGREVTLFRRYTLEFHRVPTSGGERFRFEMYRRAHWTFDIEFWRSL